MAGPEGGGEALVTWAQIGGATVVGAFGGLVWIRRFLSGRKEPPQTSMVMEQAYSTPSADLEAFAERCAKATEEMRDLIKQLLADRADERRVEREVKADHDRQDLIRMIAELKQDIARRGG